MQQEQSELTEKLADYVTANFTDVVVERRLLGSFVMLSDVL